MWILSFSDGLLSALFTNDTMCIALTKTICYVCTQRGFHPGPQMVAIAMAANLGSGATLIGNPQNAIIVSFLKKREGKKREGERPLPTRVHTCTITARCCADMR